MGSQCPLLAAQQLYSNRLGGSYPVSGCAPSHTRGPQLSHSACFHGSLTRPHDNSSGLAIVFFLPVYFSPTLARPLPRDLGSGAHRVFPLIWPLLGECLCLFQGTGHGCCVWCLSWEEAGAGGQARRDAGLPVPYWWNVDRKARASAAMVELSGKLNKEGTLGTGQTQRSHGTGSA